MAAFSLLGTIGEQVTYKEAPSIQPSADSPDYWDPVIERIPNFYWTFRRHGAALRGLPEHSSVVAAILGNPEIADHFPTITGEVNSVDIFLKNLLNKLWEGRPTFALDQQAFDKLYAALEEFLYSRKVEIRVIAPLENFTSSAQQINLAPDLAVRSLSDDEVQRLHRDNVAFRSQYPILERRYLPSFAVELRQARAKPPRDEDFPYETVQEWLNAVQGVCSVLRLFKPGAIRYSIVEFWQGREQLLGTPFTHFTPGPPIYGRAYEVADADVAGLPKLFEQFAQVAWDRNPVLQLALNRFNLAGERQSPEDRVLDLMICMEVLFLPDGNEELTFRLALRAARFLEPVDRNKRAELFANLKEGYKVRSAIVHGAVASRKQKMSPAQASELLEGTARAALRKAISLCSGKGTFSVDWVGLVLE